MKLKNVILSVSIFMALGVNAAESNLKVSPISYDLTVLEKNKNHLVDVNSSYENLISKADKALSNAIDPVVNKTLLPASGDKHDYYSFGPYWWPNPDTKDGLPYIRKDGQYNMDTKTSATDKQRLISFANDVKILGLAYYFTENEEYANKAVEQLKAWLVDPDTRMNPNMNYAQAIPGIVDGRGIGIIDSRLFIGVVDSVELIKPRLSEQDYAQIVSWFKQFNDWLISSNNGFEEDNWHNNHGTWFDAQVVAFSIFTKQPDLAKKRLRVTQMRRIGGHFNTEGQQHAELERTQPWHYSNFNLEAYNLLGHYGELVGVDVWNYEVDKHSLNNGYKYIAKYVITPNEWPYKELKGMKKDIAYENMLYAERAYDDEIFDKALSELKQSKENEEKIINLLF
ncbi:alginate lyase [Vibrio diazotrophicus]|uniref:Alginate lyase n=1 Tax=Vibrio diazotrophicus TaxID=685 RepID=A0A329EBA6_VIBDI|nr:alginate lyase family protein [Vibrio diazotrophicus]RAS66437.1 alginate lyase [Vibrio diazotrophicus]